VGARRGTSDFDDMIREYKAKNGIAEKAIDMVNT
jgi:hypothetical protein